MNLDSKIYVAGATGSVGSAVVRRLNKVGYTNVYTHRYDLTNFNEAYEATYDIEYVFLCAAKVGGILANNTHPVSFFETNIQIQNNVIKTAWINKVKKLLFLGSSCIYPNNIIKPITESDLLNGPLESTNSAYAIAKIAGIELLKAYKKEHGFNSIALMPTNLYGPGDNFDLQSSHVLPALISKFHTAKINKNSYVECWGDGSPKREFLHVDDLANACVHLMNNYESDNIINVGYGSDITIKELAEMIKNIVGYEGEIVWDTTKPNGTPRKLLDISKIINTGWKPNISLESGIKNTYEWYLKQI